MTMDDITALAAKMLGLDNAAALEDAHRDLLIHYLREGVRRACMEKRPPVKWEEQTLDSEGKLAWSALTEVALGIGTVRLAEKELPFSQGLEEEGYVLCAPAGAGETVKIGYYYLPGDLSGTDVPPLPEWFQPYLADYGVVRMLCSGDASAPGQAEMHRGEWLEALRLLEPVNGRATFFRGLYGR